MSFCLLARNAGARLLLHVRAKIRIWKLPMHTGLTLTAIADGVGQ